MNIFSKKYAGKKEDHPRWRFSMYAVQVSGFVRPI